MLIWLLIVVIFAVGTRTRVYRIEDLEAQIRAGKEKERTDLRPAAPPFLPTTSTPTVGAGVQGDERIFGFVAAAHESSTPGHAGAVRPKRPEGWTDAGWAPGWNFHRRNDDDAAGFHGEAPRRTDPHGNGAAGFRGEAPRRSDFLDNGAAGFGGEARRADFREQPRRPARTYEEERHHPDFLGHHRDARARDEHPSYRDTRSKVGKILNESTKVIRIKLCKTSDVISFLDNLYKLERDIETVYPDESEMVKCKIAMNKFDDDVRNDGDYIFEMMSQDNVWDLGEFLKRVFKLNFPASQSSMELAFRALSQSYPEKISLSDYARKFRTLVKLQELDIRKMTCRFIDGISSVQVRMALRGQALDGVGFSELVSRAIQIQNHYSMEKTAVKSLVAREEDEGGEVYKIMGVPVGKYVEEARRKGVGKRCFNCFGAHQATECRLRTCKFCDRPVAEAMHYSLLCKRAPKSLERFLDARQNQKVKNEGVRFADDYDGYAFDSDELSE